MSESSLVTVVITFYNQKNLVSRALRSVLTQTYKDLDVIVVDDGSVDDIASEVKQFDDPRIRFFRQENSGVATARNLGVNNALGEYVAFLDGDDVFLPEKIQRQIMLLKSEDVKVIACGCYFLTKRGIVIKKRICGKFRTSPGDSISEFPKINPSLLLYHKSIFEVLGGFPEAFRIGEDGMFHRRMFYRFPIICMTDILVLKEKDDESGKSRRMLASYDDTYKSLNQKIDCMKDTLSSEDHPLYAANLKKSNLCGLLSVGNMNAARRWRREVLKGMPIKEMRLERLSVSSGINVYRFVLRCSNIINFFRYLPITLSNRKRWQ